jgi:CsoR family transcriptional regulator, copper-sensing transcriptional repressor
MPLSSNYSYPTGENKTYAGRDFTTSSYDRTKIKKTFTAIETMTTSDFHPDTEPLHQHDAAHTHLHSEESIRKVVNRLSRIEGHIRGIKTMVQSDRPCPDVLVQVAAVRGALDRVARLILDEHLSQCVARAAQEGNIEAEIEELKTALDRFLI